MCYVACVLLYKEGVPLEEISCPCGHGYWDVFQERFVSGDEVRAATAPQRAEYEQRVRETFTEPGEYEARMRAQYIAHFNTCETKKAMEEAVEQEGGILDTSTAKRTAQELEEIERGDFTSRGLSEGNHLTSTDERSGQEERQEPTFATDTPSLSAQPYSPADGADTAPSSSAAETVSHTLSAEAEEYRTAAGDRAGQSPKD